MTLPCWKRRDRLFLCDPLVFLSSHVYCVTSDWLSMPCCSSFISLSSSARHHHWLPAGKEIIKLSCLCWCKFQAADIHIYSGHWLILFKHQKRILQEENPSWCLTSISKELQKTIYTFNENFCCMKFLKWLYSTYFNPYL